MEICHAKVKKRNDPVELESYREGTKQLIDDNAFLRRVGK